jgi:adenylyltransferase/sulfurtransferase
VATLTDEALLRYSRQIMLPEIDVAGQQRLLDASVLVVGLGGLGAPVSMYLTAAGVGRLVLVDHDTVDLSNLQRQIVHRNDAIGRSKVVSAAATLRALRPDVALDLVAERLAGDALAAAVAAASVVVDATDNFRARYALNDACFATGVPLVSGAAIRFEGQVAVFDPRRADSPCYRCLYPQGADEALNCSENGVAAPVVGIVGTVQAMECLKLITGVGEPLVGHLLVLDAMHMDWHKFRLSRMAGCPTCGQRATA